MALTKVTGQVIKNTTDVTVGVLTVTNTLAVGGTVSVGGTLTYEDVTNVDAVGLITARNGIVVGSGITLSKDGDIFATGVTTSTTFVGNLTGNVTGTLQTAAQSNITSLGSLSSLVVTGGLTATTGNITTLRTPTGISTHFTADKISLPDSSDGSLCIGIGSDLKFNHNGTHSYITEVGGGDLYIQGSDIILRDAGTLDKHIEMTQNGAVDIYHDNSKKFETSSSGVTISGDNSTGSYIKGVTRFTPNDSTTVKVMWDEGGFSGAGHFQVKDGVAFTAGDSSDLKIYHDGSSTSHVAEGTGNLRISVAGGSNQIQLTKGTAPTENIAKFIADGAVELYHNNIKMFETTSYGTSTQGTHIVFGAEGGDAILQLRADEGDDSADKFRIISQASDNTLRIMDIPDGGTWEDKIVCNNNAGVELYYNNSKKAESNDAGFRVSGALQSSSGNGNYYLRTQHTTIQEGGNSVTITLSGLTFSFGVFRIGGYASAGQASVSLHILFGGYMTHTANYNATVLANHAQGSSISLTKNNSSYVITITNNANNYDLFCNMMIESANSAFAMALS